MLDIKDVCIVRYDKEKYKESMKSFDCGSPTFNAFIYIACHYGTTFLIVRESTDEIVGFLSFCASSIKYEQKVFPAIELKLFAIDKKWHGYKIGDETIAQIFLELFLNHFREISKTVIKADYIILFSLDQRSRRFYNRANFIEVGSTISEKSVMKGCFENNCIPMFLRI